MHRESWGWALACVGRDPELAHEVLQTVYVRVLSGVAVPHGRSSFRTWVFGVIRMAALEALRSRRRADDRLADEGSAIDAADSAPLPDIVVERAERVAVLNAALAGLSVRQREVLHLVFYHGMTIEEAARVMNVSLGSARTHYKRGKAALALAVAHLREDVK
ncbi:MAG TPA: sigma-70 family RNA polymerase sigma factor [Gemmatimonadaceae bacterium]